MNRDLVQKLLDEVRVVDTEDNAAFKSIVNRLFEVLDLKDIEVARQFDMSRPSNTRWRNGRTVPHPAVRKHVYAWMRKRLAQALETPKKATP